MSCAEPTSPEPRPPVARVKQVRTAAYRPVGSEGRLSYAGRYRLGTRLGVGGMGAVYEAWDPELGRRVAVKLMRPRSGPDATEAQARLRREAQSMAALHHPNVLSIFDVGLTPSGVFLAMPLIEGLDLARWLHEERPGYARIVEVFCAAGRGLSAAHAARIVHRDFKPTNVLIGRDLGVFVADFGIAALVADDSSPDARDEEQTLPQPRLTRRGSAMGTPAYMAPEQHEGRPVDARSDQFSFCVALYELLYGVRPFLGPSVLALARQKWHQQVRDPRRGPLPSRGRDVPRWLHRAVVRGLHPDPDQRWPSMDVLLEALAPDRQPPKRWRWLLVAGLCLVLGGIGGGMVGNLLEAAETSHCSSFGRSLLPAGLAEGLTPASACRDDPGHARPTVAPTHARPAGPSAREPLKSRN